MTATERSIGFKFSRQFILSNCIPVFRWQQHEVLRIALHLLEAVTFLCLITGLERRYFRNIVLFYISPITGFSYLTNWLAYLYGPIQSPRPDVMPDRREGIMRAAGFGFARIDTQAS